MPLPRSGTQSSSGSLTLEVHACRHKKNTNFFLSELVLARLQSTKLRFRIAASNGAVTGTSQPRPSSLQQTCIGRLAFSWSMASRAGKWFLYRVLSHTLFSHEMSRTTQTRHAFRHRKWKHTPQTAVFTTNCELTCEPPGTKHSRNPFQIVLQHWSASQPWERDANTRRVRMGQQTPVKSS